MMNLIILLDESYKFSILDIRTKFRNFIVWTVNVRRVELHMHQLQILRYYLIGHEAICSGWILLLLQTILENCKFLQKKEKHRRFFYNRPSNCQIETLGTLRCRALSNLTDGTVAYKMPTPEEIFKNPDVTQVYLVLKISHCRVNYYNQIKALLVRLKISFLMFQASLDIKKESL